MRTAIIERATHLFADKGYAAVSMRDIAKAVGIRPASIYHHFESKDSLYRDILFSCFSNISPDAAAIVTRTDDPRRKFEDLLTWMAALFVQETVFSRLLRWELLNGDNDRIAFITRHIFQDVEDDLVDFIHEVRPDLDGGLLTTAAISLIYGYYSVAPIHRRLTGTGKRFDDPAFFAAFATRLILDGGAGTVGEEPAVENRGTIR